MISNIKAILISLAGLAAAALYIFKKGEQSEKNKSYKRTVKVAQKSKKIRRRIKNTPNNKLDGEYDELLRDLESK